MNTTKHTSTRKAELAAYQRAYRAKHRDKLNARGREYRAEHKEKFRERDKAKYAADPEKFIAKACEYYSKNKDRVRDRQLQRTYGISLADFNRMLTEQGGRCAICRTDAPKGRGKFHVDHCHKTNRVRGLLCTLCNTMIGRGQDSTEIFVAAVRYLTETTGICNS